jgi:hypothetical protein
VIPFGGCGISILEGYPKFEPVANEQVNPLSFSETCASSLSPDPSMCIDKNVPYVFVGVHRHQPKKFKFKFESRHRALSSSSSRAIAP